MGNKFTVYQSITDSTNQNKVTIKKDWSTEKYTYGDNV